MRTLPELDHLSEVTGLSVTDNEALREVPPWPALRSVDNAGFLRNAVLRSVLALSALEGARELYVDDNPELVELDLGSLARVDDLLRVTRNPLLDSARVPRPAGATVVVGRNFGEAVPLDPCPWSGNGYCEGPPVDDLCELGADSDCQGATP
jgi:hypothetical protein